MALYFLESGSLANSTFILSVILIFYFCPKLSVTLGFQNKLYYFFIDFTLRRYLFPSLIYLSSKKGMDNLNICYKKKKKIDYYIFFNMCIFTLNDT